MVHLFVTGRTFSPISSTWTWADSEQSLFAFCLLCCGFTFENFSDHFGIAGERCNFWETREDFHRYILIRIHLAAEKSICDQIFSKKLFT
jgi:hypothetical protein